MKYKIQILVGFVICFFTFVSISISQTKAVSMDKNFIKHKVSEGDTLYLLAAYYFDNARIWNKIYNANKEKILNPNVLEIGTILTIPKNKKDWKPKFSLELWRKENK